jgi:peptidyl-prolyl cis-trans isomerase A (cyclophilin A)
MWSLAMTRKTRYLTAALVAATAIWNGCTRTAPPEKKAAEERPMAEPPKPAAEAPKEAAKAEPAKAPEKKPNLLDPSSLNEKAPEQFLARFETSKGVFVVRVERAWAPKGADRFYNLVKAGFYDDNRFFRVVPRFIIQWGIPGNPRVAAAWDQARIDDDPVLRSNTRGYVTFATAGPNTRTTQLFINFGQNSRLDDQGFAPFGRVTEGMEVVEKLYAGYGEAPDQDAITAQGNAYLKAQFPNLDYIRKATIAE